MIFISVQLSAVTLLCLTSVISGINFKVAVVMEQNAVNISLIDLAVSKRVNLNWRLLSDHTMSYVTVQVSVNGGQQAARDVCSHTNLSALLTIGSCGLVSEMSSLAKSLQLPFIALPTALCDPTPSSYGAIGSHGVHEFVNAAVTAMSTRKADRVVILYDSAHGGRILQRMQNGLSSIGVSSITFNTDAANESLTGDLSEKLRHLMKKRLFNSIVMAMPHNALRIAAAADAASVMQQNYFWLMIDSGLSKSQLMTVCPINCNLALLRGGTTGVNDPGHCSTAVRDVFEECDTDNIRTLDVRLVDAIEALAVALTNSMMMDPRFQASNASCFPLQSWSSGPDILNNLISLSNYQSDRGVISYNSTTRFFNAQGVEIVASFTDHVTSPVRFVLSAEIKDNTLTKRFFKQGSGFVFPNTFTGFNNETLIACAPVYFPTTGVSQELGNNTFLGYGVIPDLMEYLAQKLSFQYVLKKPEDGNWGDLNRKFGNFTGCVGEVQTGLVNLGAGPFTKTTVRDSVIDFSADLHAEYAGILVPKPAVGTKMWNVFLPLTWHVWVTLTATFFVAAFSVWILAYFSPFSAINLALEDASDDEISFFQYMWTILGSFLLQGQEFYPSATSSRVVLAFWWFFNVILYSAYTAFLTSTLTVALSQLQIKTLEDLASQTIVRPGAKPHTSTYNLLKTAESGVYKRIADMLVEAPECPNAAPHSNIACIGDLVQLRYIARVNCSSVYVADEQFNAATVALMYPEDSIFVELMDFHIRKFRESGQMQHLMDKYYLPDADPRCSVGTYTGAESIGLDTVFGCFIVTGVFYGIGLLLLIGELLLVKTHRINCDKSC